LQILKHFIVIHKRIVRYLSAAEIDVFIRPFVAP